MVSLHEKDERLKLGIIVLGIIALQCIVLNVYCNGLLKEVNQQLITQNQAIVGTVATYDDNLAKEIIPIITGKEEKNVEVGYDVLENYSYNNITYKNNPLIGNYMMGNLQVTVIISAICFMLIVFSIIKVLNPLYKEVRYLTYRAENLLENNFIARNGELYKGSLDKFILKFSMMEDRILNSISMLQQEKINLKNIINDISHQLKTPLMALSMYNEILNDYNNMEKEDVDNFIQLSKEQIERMNWLVKTLLKYARLESNVVEYKKEVQNLRGTVEECIEPLRIKLKEKNQHLVLEGKDEILLYHDRNWIGEAISNIVKNAIEHTGEEGTIEVGIDETPISIRVWIKDNGEGIAESEIKKIFNRFHKGENSINPTSVGIGLCLSKAIVVAHNGDITVESELGVGSIFFITFIKINN